jgi:S1-C subfamily serine protease
MFAQAVKKAREFTRPVVISIALPNGNIGSIMGACVVVNRDGWVLTANHIIELEAQFAAGKQAFKNYQALVEEIQQNKGLLNDMKAKKIRKLGGPPRNSVMDFAFWWGQNACRLAEARVLAEVDLALVRLDGFDGSGITAYPTFKDPAVDIDPGTSICRLGFPFMEVKQSFANGTFAIDPSDLVFFPNEGIYTRTIVKSPGVLLIETSSPGLKGQSGGPLFDKNGTVWGIQSSTGHLALGFSPPVPGGQPGQVEHQFLNVGRGAHPEMIVKLLRDSNVSFDLI